MLRCAKSHSGRNTGSVPLRAAWFGDLHDGYKPLSIFRNPLRDLARLFAAALLGMMAAGCSLTMHLASLQVDPETTASVPRVPSPLDPALDDEDWRRAQAALSLAVDPQGSGQPVNWDNPATRRKGTFMPSGHLVLVENTVCRSFSATITQSGTPARETHHIGQACRIGPGEWAMRHVQPASDLTTAKAGASGKAQASDTSRAGLPSKAGLSFQAMPAPTTSILVTGESEP